MMKTNDSSTSHGLVNKVTIQKDRANVRPRGESTEKSRFEASVNIFVDSTQKEQVLDALSRLDNIEEIYDVTGEFDIVSIVSAPSLEEFRDVLREKIMKIKGIKSAITSIVLKAHKRSKSALNDIDTP
jgi:DNA-binding Lrp family transcriptional regulator